MLSILASFAQEESVNNSKNVKWAKRKKFEQGCPHAKFNLYGYVWIGTQMVIVQNEADIVKKIYREYLAGKSAPDIARDLSKKGVTTRNGSRWSNSSVRYILKNANYTGNLLL